MRLEKITNANLELAIKIAKEIFPYEIHDGKFWPESAYKEAIDKNWFNFTYFIAYHELSPVGITGYYPPDDDKPDIWVGWFGVLPKFRKRGFGENILGETIRIVKLMGAKTLCLYSGDREEEFAAHRLYLKMGFKETERGEVDSSPVIYFAKSL